MTIFLNGLMVVMSVLFFAGRLYEISVLMYTDSGFLSAGGIVTSPLMLAILFAMAVCCGILMFPPKSGKIKPVKFPMGIFGFSSALFLIISAVLNIVYIFKHGGFLGYDIMVILSAIGLGVFGAIGIKGKKNEMVPFLFTMLLPVAICIDCIILNIKPIHNTEFLIRCLSGIVCLIFFLLLFKCTYAPKKFTLMGLYVFALINFMIGSAANLASIIGSMMNGTSQMADIMFKIALVILGTYSLFIAFYIAPTKQPVLEKTKSNTNNDVAVPYMIEDMEDEKEYRIADKISAETISRIFNQKDEKVNTSYKKSAVTSHGKKSSTKKDGITYKSGGSTKDSGKKVVYKAPK